YLCDAVAVMIYHYDESERIAVRTEYKTFYTLPDGPWRPVMLRRLFQTGSDLPKGSVRKALFGEEEKDESTKSVKRIKHDD
ncbi:hypothetical protein Tco_0757974, partial [Tanacetum coccineum]